jgi:hypothetical protein
MCIHTGSRNNHWLVRSRLLSPAVPFIAERSFTEIAHNFLSPAVPFIIERSFFRSCIGRRAAADCVGMRLAGASGAYHTLDNVRAHVRVGQTHQVATFMFGVLRPS